MINKKYFFGAVFLFLFFYSSIGNCSNKDTLIFFRRHTIYFNPAKLGGDVVGLTNIWFCGGYRYGLKDYDQIDIFLGAIIYSQPSSGGLSGIAISAGKSNGIMGGVEYIHAFDERRKSYYGLNATIHYTTTSRSDIGPPFPPLYTTNPVISYFVFRTSLALMPKIGYIMKVKGKWQYVDISIGAGIKYITSQNSLDANLALHANADKEFPYNKAFDHGSSFVFCLAIDLKFMRTFNQQKK